MIGRVELERLLVIVNGNWTIECVVLAIVAAFYLYRLSKNLGFGWRNWLFDLVPGMRVGIAVLLIAIGSAIVRGTVWAWGEFYNRGDLTQEMLLLVVLGAAVGAGGFLVAIVEIGVPLFGNSAWMITVGSMVVFTIVTLIIG